MTKCTPNPTTAPAIRFPVPKYIPRNSPSDGNAKIIAIKVLIQIVLIKTSGVTSYFFLGNLNILEFYSSSRINFDIVTSVGIFCSIAYAIAAKFLTSNAVNFVIPTIVAKLNIFVNDLSAV